MTKEEIANQIHQPKPDADVMLSRDGFNYWCGASVDKDDRYNRLDIFFYELTTKKILTSWRRAEFDGWMITWLPHSQVLRGPEDKKVKEDIRRKLNVASREWRKQNKDK